MVTSKHDLPAVGSNDLVVSKLYTSTLSMFHRWMFSTILATLFLLLSSATTRPYAHMTVIFKSSSPPLDNMRVMVIGG